MQTKLTLRLEMIARAIARRANPFLNTVRYACYFSTGASRAYNAVQWKRCTPC